VEDSLGPDHRSGQRPLRQCRPDSSTLSLVAQRCSDHRPTADRRLRPDHLRRSWPQQARRSVQRSVPETAIVEGDCDAAFPRLRRGFQSKGSRSAKRRVRKMARRPAWFRKDCAPVLSRRIVQSADAGSVIVIETLILSSAVVASGDGITAGAAPSFESSRPTRPKNPAAALKPSIPGAPVSGARGGASCAGGTDRHSRSSCACCVATRSTQTGTS